MNNTWCFGDVHGAYKALKQIFERAPIKKGDTIISLGDICDGWSEVYECVELLLEMEKNYNMIFIRGNHCDWFRQWLKNGQHPCSWLQGGEGTLKSYCDNLDREYVTKDRGYMTNLIFEDIPLSHIEFFLSKQRPYYVDSDNRLFVHGGFNRHYPITDSVFNGEDVLMWDRDMWMAALSYGKIEPGDALVRPRFKMNGDFKEVYIGHTATINWKKDTPMEAANVINLDTGAGFKGKLTIMNIDTKEIWQSDSVNELYNNEKGRN